ncbi:MAG: glutathione S-transferase family protein [Reyranella sp.]|uniref:glutathione S-transferase family protein n=1 Tax=Reyranella sp. TaxID=1929291 RepID=UPI001AC197BB|nr:glutathione S-transferase family protein [Reyranella sp.]MBN9087903.1 glutathione S-transferase family protein [Reyranella sp.]
MTLDFYYASGSPYAWRVWLALTHKGIAFDWKLLSFDAGDLEKPAFRSINPRQKVPAIVDDGFALYESAAILEYFEDKQPEPRLFSADIKERATQRRLVREADNYFAEAMEHLLEAVMEKKPADPAAMHKEIASWESALTGDFLAGPMSAADFTLYPMAALLERVAVRNPQALPADLIPPRLAAWMARMAALDIVQKTRPPHWK